MIQDRRNPKKHWYQINGRRGSFLLLWASLHAVLGVWFLTMERSSLTYSTFSFVETMWGLPIEVVSAPWFVSSVCATFAAFRVPPGHDTWGFKALITVEWGFVVPYALSVVFGTNPRGWLLAYMFLTLGAAVLTVSGMISARNVAVRRTGAT